MQRSVYRPVYDSKVEFKRMFQLNRKQKYDHCHKNTAIETTYLSNLDNNKYLIRINPIFTMETRKHRTQRIKTKIINYDPDILPIQTDNQQYVNYLRALIFIKIASIH